MNLCCPSSELGCNIAGKGLRIAACHIHIKIFICLQFVEHIINGDFNISVFRITNLRCKLNLIYEQIKLSVFVGINYVLNILTKSDRIPELIIFSLVQLNLYNLLLFYAALQQIIVKQLEQQNRLSASSNAGNDFNLAIPHIPYYFV